MQLRLCAPLIVSLFVVFLLCQCATKHQPQVFPPYFSLLPEEYFGSGLVGEIKTLEEKAEKEPLTLLEKKRLYDLWTIEVRGLKTNSPRFQVIAEKAEQLRPEIEYLQNDVGRLKVEILASLVSDSNEKTSFENARLRKEWQTAYQAWNKDNNDRALHKIEQILTSDELKKVANPNEWMKLLNLRFRITLDLFRRPAMEESYQALKSFADCAPETTYAGFVMALFAFVDGNHAKAREIFNSQCDKDESYTNQLRRAYWNFRFQEKEGGDKAYQAINAIPAPGYYAYLARAGRSEKMQIALPVDRAPQYLKSEWSVKNDVHALLLQAEERLRLGMRRDAIAYLGKAALLMKANSAENLLPLLYTAYLFRAAGNHLESMKIFTQLSGNIKLDEKDTWQEIEGELTEIFPRPFAAVVEGSARDWKIDPDFVYSIMRQESAFNPGATSTADARGLMQMMPQLGKALATQWKSSRLFQEKALYHGEENIKLATFHLHQLEMLAPHYALMAAAYNAGINRVNLWWKRFGNLPLDVFVELIPISETRNYVKLVLRNFIYYKAMRNGGGVEPGLFTLTLPPFNGNGAQKVSLTP